MSIAQSFLPEFDNEMATTRRLLALVPDGRADWKAHPKSFSIGAIAAHLATIPTWVTTAFSGTEFDFNPPGGPGFVRPTFKGTQATLEMFDANAAAARAAIAAASDEDFAVNWSLKNNGQTQMTMSRVHCVRGFVLNHSIHHRGQLSVYLRLLDVPLPSIYGPTADT